MIYIVLIVLFIIFLSAYIMGDLFVEQALNMKKIRDKGNKSLQNNKLTQDYPPYEPGIYCQDMSKWVLNDSNYRNVSIINDGLNLNAVYIENPASHRFVLFFHGYSSKAVGYGSFLHKFYLEGFNVLAPDMRAHGSSDGTYTTMGYFERLDYLKWIDYILKQDPMAEIVLYGISMGAACAMFTCGEKLPPNVICCIEDCGFSSVWEELRHECASSLHIPAFPVLFFANVVSRVKLHFDMHKADTAAFLCRAEIPVMFIHGKKDAFVPFEMLQKNYDACRSEKTMLVMENAAHGRCSSAEPVRYWKEVFEFIRKYSK